MSLIGQKKSAMKECLLLASNNKLNLTAIFYGNDACIISIVYENQFNFDDI